MTARLRADEWIFDTPRLHIRPLAPADETLYAELYSDPETMKYIGAPLTRQRAVRSFRKLLGSAPTPAAGLVLTIVERATGAAIGLCSVQNIDLSSSTAEAGIILRAQARSRGYSREGLGAVVAHAFRILHLREVWVQISADYAVVRRLVASVGFTRCDGRAAAAPGVEVWRRQRTDRRDS
jgi:[ribosomal protein S5]-alanine N-acetyltransferase